MTTDADIFISFPGKDRKVATTLCAALESRGFTCWISARDISPGDNFQVAIVRAIRKAKVMLLVFTANSNQSEEMSKELALASQQKLAVIPLRVEDVTPNDAFAYEFATRQWIDFFADWEYAIDQLALQIGKITAPDPALMVAGRAAAAVAAAPAAKAAPKVEPAPKAAGKPAKPAIDASPGPVLAPVLDGKSDAFAGPGDDADAPAAKKGSASLMLAGAALVVFLAVTAAVFAFSGHKGKPAAGAHDKPATAAVGAPPVPPAPPPVAAPAQAMTPEAGAAPVAASAATPDATVGAAPTAAAAAPVRAKAHVAPAKKAHAPLRASRSDVPY